MNYLVAGLAYGDEGKGSCVDFLVRESGAKLVVRYNGGPQAAHNVVTPEGLHHEFHQIGSGAFAGAATYLSRFMPIEPFALVNEQEAFGEKVERLEVPYVEEDAPIITPFHWLTNRIRETMRGNARHGSCGMGVGELKTDIAQNRFYLRAADLRKHESRLEDYLRFIRDMKVQQVLDIGGDPRPLFEENIGKIATTYTYIYRNRIKVVGNQQFLTLPGPYVFEGAQGMLLDQHFGEHPHRTYSDCTFNNALAMLEGSNLPYTKIGVLRTYFTRHGAGPFPTESPDINWPDHNKQGEWQGNFRQGYFDITAARYALESIGGVDMIALTHVDRARDGFAADLEAVLGYKIGITSAGPTYREKSWR